AHVRRVPPEVNGTNRGYWEAVVRRDVAADAVGMQEPDSSPAEQFVVRARAQQRGPVFVKSQRAVERDVLQLGGLLKPRLEPENRFVRHRSQWVDDERPCLTRRRGRADDFDVVNAGRGQDAPVDTNAVEILPDPLNRKDPV